MNHFRKIFLVIFFVAGAVSLSHAETLQLDKLKASFLLGICDFTKWDSPVEGKKVVGVVGEENLYLELLNLLESKKGLADDYEIRRVTHESELPGLHVIYVGKPHEKAWIDILMNSPHLPVIKMGDSSFFFEQCGTIQFAASNNRLTFSINIDGIPKGVRLSSKLMSLSSNL